MPDSFAIRPPDYLMKTVDALFQKFPQKRDDAFFIILLAF